MKRKKMKVNILSLLGLAAMLFTACATDDVAHDRQNQKQKSDGEGLTAFSVNNETPPTKPTTRTAGEYTGTGVRFYWTEYDKLGVEVEADPVTHRKVFLWDDRNDIKDQLQASGKDRTPRATFWFSGDYTAPQYPVRYIGNWENPFFYIAKIESKQEQTKPNDAAELGKYGDCGTGMAYRQTDGNYTFMIDHKASYITFLPYTSQKGVARAKIEKIKVTADKAVCGIFKFDDNGIDLSSRPATTDDNNHIELKLNNFPIPLTNPDANANAAIMVIAPGTYSKFTVEYTIYEDNSYPHDGTGVRGTITKEYSNVTFTAGKNKIISQNLQVPEYRGDVYYMWDAAVGQHYWKGYEWNGPHPEQPTFSYQITGSTNYPKDNTDPRWYRELPNGLTRDADIEAKRSCKDCPNVNELYWYVEKGDYYWDNSLWVCMDHLNKGGHWLKKLSVIAKEEGKSVSDLKNVSPDGKDHRKEGMPLPVYRRILSNDHWACKPANINDYFYLPDLSFYHHTGGPGGQGTYWSSTPIYDWDSVWGPHFTKNAYWLFLGGTFIELNSMTADRGCPQNWPTDR